MRLWSDASTTEGRTVATGRSPVTIYQLTAESLDAPTVMLNGEVLNAADDGTLPELDGDEVDGAVTIPPASVTYIVDPTPEPACEA